jgi:hypothetical protein
MTTKARTHITITLDFFIEVLRIGRNRITLPYGEKFLRIYKSRMEPPSIRTSTNRDAGITQRRLVPELLRTVESWMTSSGAGTGLLVRQGNPAICDLATRFLI